MARQYTALCIVEGTIIAEVCATAAQAHRCGARLDMLYTVEEREADRDLQAATWCADCAHHQCPACTAYGQVASLTWLRQERHRRYCGPRETGGERCPWHERQQPHPGSQEPPETP